MGKRKRIKIRRRRVKVHRARRLRIVAANLYTPKHAERAHHQIVRRHNPLHYTLCIHILIRNPNKITVCGWTLTRKNTFLTTHGEQTCCFTALVVSDGWNKEVRDRTTLYMDFPKAFGGHHTILPFHTQHILKLLCCDFRVRSGTSTHCGLKVSTVCEIWHLVAYIQDITITLSLYTQSSKPPPVRTKEQRLAAPPGSRGTYLIEVNAIRWFER